MYNNNNKVYKYCVILISSFNLLLHKGLSPNTKSYPSILLKEKLLEVLEKKEVALDGLLKALGLKEEASKHFKSVHEVVYNFEERHGQLSLPNWKIVFEETGCLEDFLGVIESFNEQRHSPGKNFREASYSFLSQHAIKINLIRKLHEIL